MATDRFGAFLGGVPQATRRALEELRRRIESNAADIATVRSALPSRVRLRRSAAQSVASSTNTSITWDTEDYDTDALHSTVSNTERITIPTGLGGVWLVAYSINAAAAGSGIAAAWIEDQDLVRYATSEGPCANAPTLTGTSFVVLEPGDWLRVRVFQNSGGALNYATSATIHHFQAVRLSA